jgi:MYXO-CTERM domain-containing protein
VSSGTTSSGTPDVDELRREIDSTREHLGGTVQELADRADVKAAVQERVADLRSKANPTPVAAAAGGTVALVGLVALLRRRRRRLRSRTARARARRR